LQVLQRIQRADDAFILIAWYVPPGCEFFDAVPRRHCMSGGPPMRLACRAASQTAGCKAAAASDHCRSKAHESEDTWANSRPHQAGIDPVKAFDLLPREETASR
jgi:hypothetical protein